MKRNHKYLILLIIFCGVLVPPAHAQSADAYPSRPIRMITPAPPGGTTDLLARLLSPHLSQALGRQVIVDNRGGGGGVVAAELTAKAAPDGHTLLMAYSQHTTNVSLSAKPSYRAVDDYQPIVHVSNAALVLTVNNALPVHSVQDVINYGKTNPGKLNFGSAGNGSTGHISLELFKSMTGMRAQHIPYKGAGPSLVDLVGGNVQASFAGLLPVLPLIRSARVRPLAVTAAKRLSALPELPTISETGIPGYEMVTWFGILAPAGVPKSVVTKLNNEVVKILRTPDVEQRLTSDGAEVIGGTPEAFEKTLRAEMERLAKLVKATGARLD
jgi:tripartite-type tricarboxylate transporter receptor subunit TctC